MASPLEMVLAVARALVDNPDQVEARWVDNPEGGFVELKVNPQDRGKIIGKGGRNIQSLRRVATAAFGKDQERVGVELLE
jgi:predicted RNA-binding protein YlqC (UPF0109 family)